MSTQKPMSFLPDADFDQSRPQSVRSPEVGISMLRYRLEALQHRLPEFAKLLTAIVPRTDNEFAQIEHDLLKGALDALQVSTQQTAIPIKQALEQPNPIAWIEQQKQTLLEEQSRLNDQPDSNVGVIGNINRQLREWEDVLRMINGDPANSISNSENQAVYIEQQIERLKEMNSGPAQLTGPEQKSETIDSLARMHRFDKETIEEILEGTEDDEQRIFQDLVGQTEIDPPSGYRSDITLESQLSDFQHLIYIKYASWLPALGLVSRDDAHRRGIEVRNHFISERYRRQRLIGIMAGGFYNVADVGKSLNTIAGGISPEDFDSLSSSERALAPIAVQLYESRLHTYLNRRVRNVREARAHLHQIEGIKKQHPGEFEHVEEAIAELAWKKVHTPDQFGSREAEELTHLEEGLNKATEHYGTELTDEEKQYLGKGAWMEDDDIMPNRTNYEKARAKQRICEFQEREKGGKQLYPYEKEELERARTANGGADIELKTDEKTWAESKGQYSPLEVSIMHILEKELEVRYLGDETTLSRFRKKYEKPEDQTPAKLKEFIHEYYGYQVHEAIICARVRSVGSLDLATFNANWGILGTDITETLKAQSKEDVDRILNGDKMVERFNWYDRKPWVVYGQTMIYYAALNQKAEAIGLVGKHAKPEFAEERKRWEEVSRGIPKMIRLGVHEAHDAEKRIEAVNGMVRILEEVTGIEHDILMKGHFIGIGGLYHETSWRYEDTITKVLTDTLTDERAFGEAAMRFIPAEQFKKEKKDKPQALREIFDLYPILFAELLPKDAEEIAAAHLGPGWEKKWDALQDSMMLTGSYVSNHIEQWIGIDPEKKEIDFALLNRKRDERLRSYLLQHDILGDEQEKCLAVVKEIQTFFDQSNGKQRERQLAAIAALPVQYTLFHSMTPFAYARNTLMGGQASVHRRIVREIGEAQQANNAKGAILATPSQDFKETMKSLVTVKSVEDYTSVRTGEEKVKMMVDIVTDINKHRHLFLQGLPLWSALQEWVHDSEMLHDHPGLHAIFEKIFPAKSQSEEWWGSAAPDWLPEDVKAVIMTTQRSNLIARNKEFLYELRQKHHGEWTDIALWITYHQVPQLLLLAGLAIIVNEARNMGETKS